MPVFSGFFSKDEIIAALLDARRVRLRPLRRGLAGTFLTGIYTFRLFFTVLRQASAYAQEHLHEQTARKGRSR